MLQFRPISINDKKIADKILKPLNSLSCAHCFADLFIWQNVYKTQICIEDEFVFIKQELNGDIKYVFPLGNGDFKSAIEKLKEDARENNSTFIMAAINGEQKNILEKLYPNEFEIDSSRDYQDYIYNAQSLQTLAGKKLHSKRNFINRFKTSFEGQWEYTSITNENIHDVFEYHLNWCEKYTGEDAEGFFGETSAISLALKNFDALELEGGFLKLNDEIIAFTLGSKANEQIYIMHIEKADHTINGSYQMINNLFAIEHFDNVKYVNREEDLGIEGLRKAKLSYYPTMLGDNFIAKMK